MKNPSPQICILEQFFLIVGPNNYGNKIPFLSSTSFPVVKTISSKLNVAGARFGLDLDKDGKAVCRRGILIYRHLVYDIKPPIYFHQSPIVFMTFLFFEFSKSRVNRCRIFVLNSPNLAFHTIIKNHNTSFVKRIFVNW